MNYFFVNTPFQVLVAQGLIKKFELINCVLLVGTTGLNRDAQYKLIKSLLIDKIWLKMDFINELDEFIPKLSSMSSFSRAKKKFEELEILINSNPIEGVYFGDINHPAYILIAKKMKFKNINFFEEGLAHYNLSILMKKPGVAIIVFIKMLVYEFLMRVIMKTNGFSKYIFTYKKLSKFNVEINKRFNFLKRDDNYSFDENISFSEIISSGYNMANISNLLGTLESKKYILYLSSTLRNFFDNYLEIDKKCIEKINAIFDNCEILFKFHPKDDEKLKEKIMLNIKKTYPNVEFINSPTELPIEIIFSKLTLVGLVGYGSSAQVYYHQFSKKIPNLNVLDLLGDEFISKQTKKNEIMHIYGYYKNLTIKYLN